MKNLIFLVTLLVCGTFAYATAPKKYEEEGFFRIGKISGNSGKVGVQASLDLVVGPDQQDQFGAVAKCKSIFGRLVSIISSGQKSDVETALLAFSGEQFWTDGMYDGNIQNYFWLNVDLALGSLSNIDAKCLTRQNGFGIVAEGGAGINKKWCTSRQTTSLRYLCVV